MLFAGLSIGLLFIIEIPLRYALGALTLTILRISGRRYSKSDQIKFYIPLYKRSVAILGVVAASIFISLYYLFRTARISDEGTRIDVESYLVVFLFCLVPATGVFIKISQDVRNYYIRQLIVYGVIIGSFVVFLFFDSLIKTNNIVKGFPDNDIKLELNDQTSFQSNDSIIFLGATSKYYFFYNKGHYPRKNYAIPVNRITAIISMENKKGYPKP